MYTCTYVYEKPVWAAKKYIDIYLKFSSKEKSVETRNMALSLGFLVRELFLLKLCKALCLQHVYFCFPEMSGN